MRRDLILRMIDQLGAVIARIIKLVRGGDHAAAQVSLDQAVRIATGLDRVTVEKMSPPSLASFLLGDNAPSSWLDPTCILVRLLHEQSLIHRAAGQNEDADAASLKAVYLLAALRQKAGDTPLLEITPTPPELLSGVPLEKLPPNLQEAIRRRLAESAAG